ATPPYVRTMPEGISRIAARILPLMVCPELDFPLFFNIGLRRARLHALLRIVLVSVERMLLTSRSYPHGLPRGLPMKSLTRGPPPAIAGADQLSSRQKVKWRFRSETGL